MATRAHNEKRKQHCASSVTIDATMAKSLQLMISNSQNPTDPASRPEPYRTCYENFYQATWPTTDEDVRDTNVATEKWYSHHDRYDFTTGLGSPRFAADSFTAVVWDDPTGATSFKVAFARRHNFVLAWYCPGPTADKPSYGVNAPRDKITDGQYIEADYAANYAKSVKDSNCKKKCENDLVKDRYAKCYQDKALVAHNKKRDEHRVP
jgi:hypothetical protein